MPEQPPKRLIEDIARPPSGGVKPDRQLKLDTILTVPAPQTRSRGQLMLIYLALALLIISIVVGINDWRINRANQKQIASLNNHANATGGTSSNPSTVKPNQKDIKGYTVAPAMPRYLIISKLGIKARIMSQGVDDQNQLLAPSNVYDTGWYNASALPGQPGATLIDGHVSSWTTQGVFYNLKSLKSGDSLKVQLGDGAVLTYKVVKSQTFSSDSVDMAAAIRPITTGKSGLNLITCTGQVKPGTSQFNQRLIVFAEQIP